MSDMYLLHQETAREDNQHLLERAAAGDDEATALLIERNMGLVYSVASRFYDRGVEREDLFQIGTIGMLKAIRSFDLSRGCMFSTYAVPLIIGEIRRFLRDDGLLKISREQKRRGILLMREKTKFENEFGREPHISELADRCGLSVEEAAAALDCASPIHSLSESVSSDTEKLTLEMTLVNEDNMEYVIEKLSLAEAMNKLPPLWRQIVSLRFFSDLSQQATAEKLHLSQVKISREEKKIFAFLREELKNSP